MEDVASSTWMLLRDIGGLRVQCKDLDRAGRTPSEIPQIPAPFEGWSCADPEWCLETLPLSPDFELLYEDRARLAETLYFDAMPPEQFAVFRKYVR